jgi:autotransporter translocation and assembly factor TamB
MAAYAALVCGVLGLGAYIARDPVRDLLGHTASAWLSRRLDGTLEIGALRGSLVSSLVLRDVVLRDREGREVAHLDEVRLGYNLTTLLAQRLVVQYVHVVHPQATLVQDAAGQWNLSRVLAPAASSSSPPAPERATRRGWPIALTVEHVQIQDGEVDLHAAALPGVQHLTLAVQGPPEALSVHGQLRAESGRLDLHGQLNTRATPWRYSSSLELAHVNLAALLHQAPLQSDLNVQVHVEGEGLTPSTLRGEVRLDVQTSHVGSIALHSSHLQLTVRHGRFEVQQCDLQTSVARLTAAGLVDLAASSALQYDLTADLAGLRALVGPGALEGTLRVQGQASGTLTAVTLQGALTGQHLQYGDEHVETLQVTYEGTQLAAQPRLTAHLEMHQARVGQVPVERLALDAMYESTARQLAVTADLVQSSGYSGKVRASVAGPLAAPVLALEATLWPELQQHKPFDHLHATLVYAQQQLQSDIRVRQANREVLSVEARLPIDLALTPLELEQRLLPSPVALHVHLQQPDLAALSRWQPILPGFRGTLQGDLQVQGSYTALELDADVRLQQWGLQGRIEQVSAPIRLQATVGMLAPGAEPVPAGWRHHLLPRIQQATLRVPSLRGQLPGLPQPLRSFQIQELLVQVAGQWGAEGFDATLERLQAQVGVPGWPRAEVGLAGRLTPQRLDLAHLHVRLPQSEVRGSGSLTLPQRQVQLRLDMPRLRLDELGIAPPAPLPRLAQGVIAVRGSMSAPHLAAHLQYAEAQLDIDLAAQLETPAPRYSATLRLDHLKMAHVLAGEQGTLQARLQIQGIGFAETQRHAEAELHLETSGLTLAPGLTARAQAHLTGSTVQFEEIQVHSTPIAVAVRGTLSATAPTSLTYDVTLGDLTSLQQYVGVPVQARGQLSGTVQGTWPALQARGRLQVRDWAYGSLQGQRVQADLAMSHFPTAPQATINVQVVDLQGPALPRSAVTLAGTYAPSQGTVQMHVTTGPYQKSSFEGRVTLAAEQRLTLTHLRLYHTASIWENVGPLTVVRSPQGQLDLQRFALRNGRQEISARGILKSGGRLEADLQVQHLQLSPHVQMIAPQTGVVDGEGALRLSLRGTLAQLQGEGGLHLTSLRWQQHDVGEVHGQVRINGTAVGVDLRWRDHKQELLHLSGEARLDAPQALAVQLQAVNVDLQGLKTFIPAVAQSAGTLHLDLRLTGTFQHPQVYGTLRVDDGALQLTATGVRYKDIQVQLVWTGERVTVTQVHAQSGDGTLDLTGAAENAGLTLRHLNLDLQMRQFTLMHTPALEAVVSAAVALRGSLDALLATGTVSISPARVQANGKLVGGPDLVQPWQLTVDGVYGSGPQKVATEMAASGARQKTFLPFLRADLQLELPRNVWVRGPGTAVELSGALTVTKALGEPFVLGGTVETVRGFASFYSGRFAIDQGRVTFTGTPEINPALDVTVTRAVSGYTVAIHISGRAKSPQLRLSSTPDLPQADIVTLLVVGKTMDRLTAAERSGLSSHAQQIVGNVAAGELEQLLAKPLGFDTLDIQTGDKLGSSKVSVGRYVTQDIFLSYERQLGDEKGNKVGVEYSINRHLKVRGSSSTTGDSALDVLWRIDY